MKKKLKRFKSLFLKSIKVLRDRGIKTFVLFTLKYIIHGRDYFKKVAEDNLSHFESEITTPTFSSFYFVDSSVTWYGIAKQLERSLMILGYEPSNDKKGISICFANDLGEIDPYTQKKISPKNRVTLKRAVDSDADFLFYSQKICQKWFENRKNAYYMPSGVETDIFKVYPGFDRCLDVGFVGKKYDTPIRKSFIERLEMEHEKGSFKFFMPSEGGLFFEKLAKFYNNCKIVVNDSQQNEVSMRIFEATACGSLLITKRVPYLEELFEFGEEIVVYDNLDDMVKKVRYYLKNENERKRIAANGMRKTLNVHSYYDRAVFMSNKIEEFIANDFSSNKDGVCDIKSEIYNNSSHVEMPLDNDDFCAKRYIAKDGLPKEILDLCKGTVLIIKSTEGDGLQAFIDIQKITPAKATEDDDGVRAGELKNESIKSTGTHLDISGDLKLPFSDKTFDTIVVIGVFEKISDLQRGIHEIKRKMGDGGSILVCTTGFRYRGRIFHVRNFTKFDFTQMFCDMRVEFVNLKNCPNAWVKITAK